MSFQGLELAYLGLRSLSEFWNQDFHHFKYLYSERLDRPGAFNVPYDIIAQKHSPGA